jgi:hypothetical protein
MLQFVTDSAGTALGFVAQVEAVRPARCPQAANVTVGGPSTVPGPFGVFAPVPPGSTLDLDLVPAYAQGQACSWAVHVERPSHA